MSYRLKGIGNFIQSKAKQNLHVEGTMIKVKMGLN